MSGWLNCSKCRAVTKVGDHVWNDGKALCQRCGVERDVLAEKAQKRAYQSDHQVGMGDQQQFYQMHQGHNEQRLQAMQARAQPQANMQAMAENRIIQYAVGKIEERAIAKRETLVVHDNPNMTVTVAKRDPRVAELEAELNVYKQNLSQAIIDLNAVTDGNNSMSERLESLERQMAKAADYANGQLRRANELADTCGRLRDENTQLLAENARLRRGR